MVLHERAKARVSGTVPRSNRSALGTGRPPMTVWPGQATGGVGPQPGLLDAASAVTILNVEPGGKRPVSASAPAASAGPFWATASRFPVDGWTATSIACCGSGSTASSAAACRARSSATVTVLPGFGASSASVATVPPAASTTATDQPGDAVELGGEAGAHGGEHLAGEAGVRREQPLRGGEPHAGQVVDGVLDRLVVGLAQDGDGVGAAVGRARRAVGDRLLGDRRLDRRQAPWRGRR